MVGKGALDFQANHRHVTKSVVLICAVLLIPYFNVLSGYFKCSTQFGGSSRCLNFSDKFFDIAPHRYYVDQMEHKQCVMN